MIRIGVISDTHLKLVTGELRHIFKRHLADKDLIIHCGDTVSTGVVNYLDEGRFRGVYGNMDPYEVRDLLPEKEVIELGGFRLGLIHGWGAAEGLEDRIRMQFQEVDAIVYGHSHRAVSHHRDGVLFFNPGSATGYAPTGENSIGILEIGDEIRGSIITL